MPSGRPLTTSEKLQFESFKIHKAKLDNFKYAIWGLTGVGALLALWPTATVLSGERTIVSVNIALTATLGLGAALSVTLVVAVRQKRRSSRLRARNEKLDERVEELEGENERLSAQVASLKADGNTVGQGGTKTSPPGSADLNEGPAGPTEESA